MRRKVGCTKISYKRPKGRISSILKCTYCQGRGTSQPVTNRAVHFWIRKILSLNFAGETKKNFSICAEDKNLKFSQISGGRKFVKILSILCGEKNL